MLSRDQLLRAAGESGFQAESFEKAHVLVRLLAAVRVRQLSHIGSSCSRHRPACLGGAVTGSRGGGGPPTPAAPTLRTRGSPPHFRSMLHLVAADAPAWGPRSW